MRRRGLFRLLRCCTLFLFCLLLLCGCHRSSGEPETAEEADEEETEETEPAFEGEYPGTVAAKEPGEEESPYYGIMYATVLDIDGGGMDSSTVYSFKDKNDPDNAWSVTGLEIGYIEAELAAGTDGVILFHGDMVRNTEDVEFIAVLPDGGYTLKRIFGVTTANMMSSFTVQTGDGTQIQLIKDNCRIDNGAMTRDSGDPVIVYYADGGELGCYPLRVYEGK